MSLRLRYIVHILLLWVGAVLNGSLAFGDDLDVFELSSTQSLIVAQGMGYFPVLNPLGNELISVYRAGAGHLGLAGSLQISSSTAEGTIWSPAHTVIDGEMDDRNPAVGVTDTGRILAAYHEQGSYAPDGRYDPSLNKARCMITVSDDNGLTWSPPRPVGVPGLDTCSPYGRIFQLADGTLLMSVYGPYTDAFSGMEKISKEWRDYAYLVRSHDNGDTWEQPSLIAAGHNETAIFPVDGKILLAAARSERTGQLNYARSADAGMTWTDTRRLTGPNQHPGDLLRLSNGWILLLYGDRSVEDKTIQGMITRDQGRTWEIAARLIFSRPVRGDFGYPSGVLMPNGKLAIHYYWGGQAKDSYDGSQARLYMTLLDEMEFLNALSAVYQ